MTPIPFDKVVAHVKTLSPAEQQQLRVLLDTLLASTPTAITEDEFAHKLVEYGVLSEAKPPITNFAPYQNRQPIKTTGKPLSKVILEERR